MHKFTIIGMAITATVLATTTPAHARTSCNDQAWGDAAVKSLGKSNAALKLGAKGYYSAALVPARKALAIIKASAMPCDTDYWLIRRYDIKMSVALKRWLEEKRDGNWEAADRYFEDMQFWATEAGDLMEEK